MKHSAILANYNGEKYLEEAIDSILAQRDVDFEVVIVDDASTDRSPAIVAEYARKFPDKVQLVHHETNRGQGAGFNTGFAHSCGDIVSFIDSDDLWFPEKLKTVETAFHRNPNLAVFQHNLKLLDDRTMTDSLKADGMYSGELYEFWRRTKLEPLHMATSALSLSRRTLENVLPMPDYKIQADTHLFLAALLFGPVASDILPFGAYRCHDSNNYHGKNASVTDRYAQDVLVPGIRNFYDKHAPETPPLGCQRKSVLERILDMSPRSLLRRAHLLSE